MDKHFPREMEQKSIGYKMTFFLDYHADGHDDCPNCGGLGFLYLFCATDGPYETPAAAYRKDGRVSKWHDGKWWVGNTEGFRCRDCDGLGLTRVAKTFTYPIQHEITGLVRQLSIE